MRRTDGSPMRVIGITGGVGAGKSEILAFLEKECGAFAVQADGIGHQVMEPGTGGYQRIVEAFGEEVLSKEKQMKKQEGAPAFLSAPPIDRRILGELVFGDPAKREVLNGIIHPEVKAFIRREIGRVREAGNRSLFVVEAALLIEDHYEEICDEFWYIYASETVRRERLKKSRGYTEEKITAIFQSQQPETVFRARCQAVIENEGSMEETKKQILGLLGRDE